MHNYHSWKNDMSAVLTTPEGEFKIVTWKKPRTFCCSLIYVGVLTEQPRRSAFPSNLPYKPSSKVSPRMKSMIRPTSGNSFASRTYGSASVECGRGGIVNRFHTPAVKDETSVA